MTRKAPALFGCRGFSFLQGCRCFQGYRACFLRQAGCKARRRLPRAVGARLLGEKFDLLKAPDGNQQFTAPLDPAADPYGSTGQPVQRLRGNAGPLQRVLANACGEVTLPVPSEIQIGRPASRGHGVNSANDDLEGAAIGKQGARIAGGLEVVERFAPEAQAVFLGAGLGCEQCLGALRRDFRCQRDAGMALRDEVGLKPLRGGWRGVLAGKPSGGVRVSASGGARNAWAIRRP